jgi:hypothetical protein
VCSGLTRKFERKDYPNFYQALWPWLKTSALMFLTLALIVFLFRFTYFSRTQVFGPILMLLFLEGLLCVLYFSKKHYEEKDIESLQERQRALTQEKLPTRMDLEAMRKGLLMPVRERLRDIALKANPALFDFLDQALDLSNIVQAEMVIRNSSNIFYWDVLNDHPVRLLINFHKVNDIRWINRYFLEAHKMLLPGGYLIGMAHTIQTHRDRMFQQFPRILANIFYFFNFLVHRAVPKIPGLKQLYFSVTKGKDRIISKPELLGRLCFCGFRIVAEKEINKCFYYVAQKALAPSVNTKPSYGPFVELKRIGNNGEILSIYKFRTMHPYSEFLQDYVYDKNGLQKGGKLDNDFRVTTWGRVMRKFWLDELPMLYNWLKGDLQLFGVRPLSKHFLSLYPEKLQALRKQVKPGLVPPFYADMPASFEEICESERRYIEAYLRHPVKTQCRYLGRAVWNIVVQGARSR